MVSASPHDDTTLPAPRSARATNLIGGRRVTVGDLVDASLLSAGEHLRFDRPRMRRSHRAEVLADGKLRLPDGQEFTSPSRAAMMAAGMRAVDGWHVWVLESSGIVLDALRQEFLDRAVRSSGQTPVAVSAEELVPQRVHERLRDARHRAENGEPMEISVRDLLSLWGARGRGDHVTLIEADLANHGLVTRPGFRKVTLDSAVRLITAADAAVETGEEGTHTNDPPVDDSEGAEVGLTVGNLPSSAGGIASVPPHATFEHAITRMLLDDYSQLAVMRSAEMLLGAVSWRSIARARHADPDAPFSAAIVTRPCEVRYDQDLVDVLPELQRNDFLFVRGPDGTISGIVTTADVVGLYGEMATPFFLIGELDQTLRRVIIRNVTFGQVEAICNARRSRPVRSFDDLSMGDYQQVFANKEVWAALRWPLDRKHFVARLSEMREIRNDVMHFNPDPPPPGTIGKLQNIINLLRTFAD